MNDVLNRAIAFAGNAHSGVMRKGSDAPYILHPMEVTAIAGTMTADLEVLAAAMLHDVIEDTAITLKDIRTDFGERVAALVDTDTEDKREGCETWQIRKEETIEKIRHATYEEKIIAFSDKLSNLRAIHRDYLTIWEKLWERFNQKDPMAQLWYYGSFLDTCKELADTLAYREYRRLFHEVKARVIEYQDYGTHKCSLQVIVTPDSNDWVLKDESADELFIVSTENFQAFIQDMQSGNDN